MRSYPGAAEGTRGQTCGGSADWTRPVPGGKTHASLSRFICKHGKVTGLACKQGWWSLVRSYLWLCTLASRALRGGVGDPCSVTLRTSRLFLSGRHRPWRVSMGESTRFRGGSWRSKGDIKGYLTVYSYIWVTNQHKSAFFSLRAISPLLDAYIYRCAYGENVNRPRGNIS